MIIRRVLKQYGNNTWLLTISTFSSPTPPHTFLMCTISWFGAWFVQTSGDSESHSVSVLNIILNSSYEDNRRMCFTLNDNTPLTQADIIKMDDIKCNWIIMILTCGTVIQKWYAEGNVPHHSTLPEMNNNYFVILLSVQGR